VSRGPTDAAETFDLVIRPGRSSARYWRDLWAFRELFYLLSWRDVVVRYKQTVLGVAWSVLRPALAMVVFTFVFGRVAGLPADGVPYPLLVLAAMLPWQLFSAAIAEASSSLIVNAEMLTKVYFPRMIAPASAVIVALVDFAVSLSLLAVLMVWYEVAPTWRLLTLPLFLVLALVASAGFGLWLAALNVKYRDFRYALPFLLQFGIYISPVGFSSTAVPEQYRLAFSLNPMVGVIDGFRWALLGGKTFIHWPYVAVSAAMAIGILIMASRYFRQMERSFADII